jgi:aminoglycoside 2'-N-acetyltransferase I
VGSVAGVDRFEVISTADLTAAQRAAVIDLCIAAHENEAFHELFSHLVPGGQHVLASRGDDLVGHAVATTRWAQPGGHPILRTAYVDAVSTRPDVQGHGIGSEVMRRLAATVHDHQLAALQTDRPGFYERLGWRVWRGPLAGRREDELVPTPEQQGVMVLSLPSTPALDLDALLTIECQPYRIWE